MTTARVRTRALDTASIEAVLAKHHVATLGIAFHDQVSLLLVNYVYADRWVYARLETGPDLESIKHHPWVALAVNEIDGIYDWRTVTVNGSLELLKDEPATVQSREFHEALERLRAVVPEVLTTRDPMPQRVQLVRVHADELAGREARSSGRIRESSP